MTDITCIKISQIGALVIILGGLFVNPFGGVVLSISWFLLWDVLADYCKKGVTHDSALH